MLYNYLITALRNLKKRLFSTIVQSLGLAVGLAVFILVQIIASYEENFDTFFAQSDRIYSVYVEVRPESGFGLKSTDGVHTALQPVLSIDVPAIEKSARLMGRELMVRSGEQKFYESMLFADPDFLDIFDLEFMYGDAGSVLQDPTSVILSESMAAKYFGDANPLGEVFTIETRHELQVTGVFRDLPPNSHFTSSITREGSFDMVATTDALVKIAEFDPQGSWTSLSSDNMTYVLLPEGADPQDFEEQLEVISAKYLNDEIKEYMSGFGLRPLRNMNLFLWETTGIPAMAAIRLLGLIILLIACLNYTTLAAARGLSRLHEMGLRKSIGATRRELISQLLIESITLACIALIIAVVLTILIIPVIGELIDRPISLQLLHSPASMGGLLLLALVTGLVAGGYPALVISRVRIPHALRGETGRIGKRNVIRNVLLVIQYTSAFVLVIAVMVTFAQNRKLQSGSFSYLRDHIVNVFRMSNPNIAPHYDVLRAEWQAIPAVELVTVSSQVPFEQRHNMVRISPVSGDESRKVDIRRIDVGEDFEVVFDLDLLAGRHLSPRYGEDTYRLNADGEYAQSTVNAVINMRTVTALGYETPEDAIGKFMYEVGSEADDVTYRIIGVAEDVNFLGFHNQIHPTAFFMPEEVPRVASIRFSSGNLPATLGEIDAVWNRILPEYPIDRTFLEDAFDDIFSIFQGINAALAVFCVIGVSLAFFGLLGMTVFLTETRTREIGVRKVLGASVAGLIRMLTLQISRPVLVAVILAAPLAYFAMSAYLNFFTDRVSLSLFFFLNIAVVVTVIAWLVVGIQAWRVANTSPAEVLRYE
ncbi:MAG: ABC transporter permease [Fidelibacterota bacterium]|nr:MAG: ABC transporter permease [Candidatus Neomarinimicrobiota bacterium]